MHPSCNGLARQQLEPALDLAHLLLDGDATGTSAVSNDQALELRAFSKQVMQISGGDVVAHAGRWQLVGLGDQQLLQGGQLGQPLLVVNGIHHIVQGQFS